MLKKKTDLDFAAAFQELERITAWFETGTPDLDEGIKKFERALEISQALRERLKSAENRIKEIRLSGDKNL